MRYQDYKKQKLANTEFAREYNRYDLAFEVAKMLIEARRIKGITQQKLAELLKTKQSGIARSERGNTLPSLSFLERMADVYNTYLIVKFAFMESAANQTNVVGESYSTAFSSEPFQIQQTIRTMSCV